MKQANQQSENKIDYLEGLRGLAALVVVLHHFATLFFPAIVFGYSAKAHTPYEYLIYSTPLNIFFSGHFAVCIFFVLSGFVLSRSYFRSGGDTAFIRSLAVRRYFRLLLPVALSIFIGYLFMKLNILYLQDAIPYTFSTTWAQGQWNFQPSFTGMLYQAFIGIFINSPDQIISYNSSLWTMYYEFFGSFIVFGFLATVGTYRRRAIIYVALIVLFWNSLFLNFVLGMLLCDLTYTTRYRKIFTLLSHKAFIFAVIGVALLLGSYPLFDAHNTLYGKLRIPTLNPNQAATVFHTIAAFALVAALPYVGIARRILSSKPLLWLGSISFSVYVLHVLILGSVSLFVFLKLIFFVGYIKSFLIIFVFSLVLILCVADLYTRYVDKTSIALANWVWKRFTS